MKGQAAIEQITIYSFVLIVIVSLTYFCWQMGFFSFWTNRQAVHPGIFEITDWAVSNNTIQMTLKSKADFKVENLNVSTKYGWSLLNEILPGEKNTITIYASTQLDENYFIEVGVKYDMNNQSFDSKGSIAGRVE